MQQNALDCVQQFLDMLLNERRVSRHTLSNYQRDIKRLIEFCDQQDHTDWQIINDTHIRQFISQRHRRGLSGKSLQRELSAIRTFYRYLMTEGQLKHNPAELVQAPKTARNLPETLDIEKVNHLLNFEAKTDLEKRDHAILELFYSSGIRLSELIGLNTSDIDKHEKIIEVTGKGNKTRRVPVGKHALTAIETWLAVRTKLADINEKAVFVSQKGCRISPRSVQQRIKLWQQKQGIDVRIYPHILRHSFASHVLESSQDLRAVQELLGHANISTTQIYTHLDFQHLARVYDDANPRAQKKTPRKKIPQ
jgi:integrase/recombinase XerC